MGAAVRFPSLMESLIARMRSSYEYMNYLLVVQVFYRPQHQKVALQDRFLVAPVIGEEAIGSLRVGPVLARQRYGASNAAAKLMKQAAHNLLPNRASRNSQPATSPAVHDPLSDDLLTPSIRTDFVIHPRWQSPLARNNGNLDHSVDRRGA